MNQNKSMLAGVAALGITVGMLIGTHLATKPPIKMPSYEEFWRSHGGDKICDAYMTPEDWATYRDTMLKGSAERLYVACGAGLLGSYEAAKALAEGMQQ